MRKIARFILPAVCCLFISLVSAQTPGDSLMIEGKAYTLHKVLQGETLYSVCNKYKVDMTEAAVLNKLGSSGYSLNAGEIIMIPLYAKKPLVDMRNMKVSEDGYITHVVKQGETLYSICRSYNGVTVPMIKEKNSLTSDGLKINQKLLIPQDITVQSAFSHAKGTKPMSASDRPQNDGLDKVFAGSEKAAETVDVSRGVATWIKSDQDENMKNYYALHKYAPIGTVIKVRNLMNNRTTFVKVVGKLPDNEEYKSVTIKVSGAAADYLHVLDEKFLVEITIPQTAIADESRR